MSPTHRCTLLRSSRFDFPSKISRCTNQILRFDTRFPKIFFVGIQSADYRAHRFASSFLDSKTVIRHQLSWMRFVCFVNDLSIRKLSDPILPSNGREQKLGCVNSSGGGVGDGVKILSIVFFLGRGWGTQAINLEVAGDGKEDEFFRTFLLLLLLVLLV